MICERRLPAQGSTCLAGNGSGGVGVVLGGLGRGHVAGIWPGDPPAGFQEGVDPAAGQAGPAGVRLVRRRGIASLGEQPAASDEGARVVRIAAYRLVDVSVGAIAQIKRFERTGTIEESGAGFGC